MSPRTHRRRRRHQLEHQQQSRQQKQVASQLAALGGAALTQPIFLIGSIRKGVTVSRSMPVVLSSHMDDSSWNSFCDKLDDALLSITKMEKDMKNRCLLPLACFVPLVIIGLVVAAIVANLNTLLPIIFFTTFIASISWSIGMVKYSLRCRKKVTEEIEKICYNTSVFYSGISFKVFIELHYIQVIVASDKVESLEVADTASSSSPSSASSTNYNRSLNTPPTSILTLTPSSMAEAKKWRTAVDKNTNKIYYFNEETNAVTWEYPLGLDQANVEKNEKTTGEVYGSGGVGGTKVAVEPEIHVRDDRREKESP